MEFGHLSPSPVVLGGLKAAEFQNRVEKKRRENEGDRVLGREGHLPNVIRPQEKELAFLLPGVFKGAL